jgi:filamentous hemagglutinin family protein
MTPSRVLQLLTPLACVAAVYPTFAQIKTDGTIGPKANLKGPDFRIDEKLGRRFGNNLFHSFEPFNIRTLADGTIESATFAGPGELANVISRVTGGDPSEINGLLRSQIGKADFWLINPSGVAFGPNASLDVPGSFHVSTADELRFADGRAARGRAVPKKAASASSTCVSCLGRFSRGRRGCGAPRSTTPAAAIRSNRCNVRPPMTKPSRDLLHCALLSDQALGSHAHPIAGAALSRSDIQWPPVGRHRYALLR